MIALTMKAKLVIAAAVVLAVVVAGYFGVNHLINIGKDTARAEYQAKIIESMKRLDELKAGQDSINKRLDSMLRDKAKVIGEQGSSLKEKVPSHVPPTTLDLPPGFRVLHDAATDGSSVPDAAQLSDGASVPAAEVAGTVIDNYTGCRENALKVEGFQKWVLEQRELSEKATKDLAKILN